MSSLAWLAPTPMVVGAFGVTGCGGVDPLPPPPPPPPAMPAAPSADLTAPDAGPEMPPEAPVLLLAGAPAPEPTGAAPQVRIGAPARGQLVAERAAEFSVKLDVKNWPVSPTAGRVHLLLDGRLARTIADLKQPIRLGELAHGELAEGHHVLVAVLARASDETLKSKAALAVTEFFVGKKTAPGVDLKKPYVVLSKPDGAYADDDADHVLVDYQTVGAQLGDGKEKIALRLEGPGIDGSLSATTQRAVPYHMENLRAGTYALRVEILGSDGKVLANPWATTTRSINIKRAARPTETPARPSTQDESGPTDAGAADSSPDATARAAPKGRGGAVKSTR